MSLSNNWGTPLTLSAWSKLFLSYVNTVFRSLSWTFFQAIFLSLSLTANTPSFLINCSPIISWLVLIVPFVILNSSHFWSCLRYMLPNPFSHLHCKLANLQTFFSRSWSRWMTAWPDLHLTLGLSLAGSSLWEMSIPFTFCHFINRNVGNFDDRMSFLTLTQ